RTTAATPMPASTTGPTAAATVATTTPLLAGLRLVDGQGSAFNFFAIEGLNRRLSFCITSHLHEAEALGPPRVAIHNDLHGLHRAVRRKKLVEVAVARVVGEVADVQFLTHQRTPEKTAGPSQSKATGPARNDWEGKSRKGCAQRSSNHGSVRPEPMEVS